MTRWTLLCAWLGLLAAGCSHSAPPKEDVPQIPPSTRSSGASPAPAPPGK